MKAQAKGEPPLAPQPPDDPRNYIENWLELALSELLEFNKNGSIYIASCSEALIKVHGVMNKWFQNPESRRRMFFRGEHRWGWELTSRLGRRAVAKQETSPCGATPLELQLLDDFQSRTRTSRELCDDIFDSREPLPRDHPGWWTIMQHYDEVFGTRMIDITSSIFCGLYFACVGWDGEMDKEKDGRLYLFPDPYGSVRGETTSPTMIRGELNDSNDRRMNSAASYFTIEQTTDVPRFRESSFTNPRETYQDGFFFWQPRFWEPMNPGQNFKFRVARDAKEHILRELYSIGYTAIRIVRGERGRQAHEKMVGNLGLSA